MSLPINSLYSLTWGDYGTSLVSAVQLLRCHGDLVDCTLAAGGRSFPAHKIVLCAASPFLLDLLKNTPCKHPIVMLAGVNANDLEALLEFVYRGEVSVDHSQLPSLLQAAHCLNIQGLAPQTVSKDDYTQIQLHPHTLLPQHHVKAVIDVGNGNMVNVNEYGEELITTIEESPHTVHAHVVEDIIQQDPLGEVENDVKNTITQFLPTRKRRPRVNKKPANAKVLKLDENNMQTITTMNATTVLPSVTTTTIPNAVKKFENGNDSMVTIMTTTSAAAPTAVSSSAAANTSTASTLTSPSVTLNATQATPTTTAITPAKSIKSETSATKPKSRSQSEQPASCPICGAVIRQSRNLRRHLELRHFSKGVKKDKKIILDTGNIVTASGSVITGGSTSGCTISTSGIGVGNNTTSTIVNTSASGNIIATVPQIQTISVVKKEHTDEEILSTTGSSNQPQTITVSMAPNQTHHTLVDANSIINSGGNQPQHVVTQHENSDGTTSLSIAQVQTVQGHQLTLGGLNQQKNHNILVKKVFILKGNNTNT